MSANKHRQAGDEADQAIGNAPLRAQAKAGQGIAEHVADRAGEEAHHRAEGIAEEHRDGNGRAQGHLADGRNHENCPVEQPGEDRVQGRADGHPDHLAGADLPGLVLASGQVDGKGDQDAQDDEAKAQQHGGLVGLEAGHAQNVADQEDGQGEDGQHDDQGEQHVG